MAAFILFGIILLQCIFSFSVVGISIPNLKNNSKSAWRDRFEKVNAKTDLEKTALDLSPFNDVSHGSPKDVHFYLYTPESKYKMHEIFANDTNSFEAINIDPDFSLKLITHGFGGNVTGWLIALKDAYLATSNTTNIIMVDWSILAVGPNYLIAIQNTLVAGKASADLLEALITQNKAKLDNIHLIGHSLGGHVVGICGNQLNKTNGKVARVTGLDPAQPLYETAHHARRLDKLLIDGHFVDIIHTSALGIFRAMGHVDFYPAGGILQPGCNKTDPENLLGCNHGRSHDYFIASVYKPNEFPSCRCIDMIMGIPVVSSKTCKCQDSDENSTAYMGNGVSLKARGVFYLENPSLQGIKS